MWNKQSNWYGILFGDFSDDALVKQHIGLTWASNSRWVFTWERLKCPIADFMLVVAVFILSSFNPEHIARWSLCPKHWLRNQPTMLYIVTRQADNKHIDISIFNDKLHLFCLWAKPKGKKTHKSPCIPSVQFGLKIPLLLDNLKLKKWCKSVRHTFPYVLMKDRKQCYLDMKLNSLSRGVNFVRLWKS